MQPNCFGETVGDVEVKAPVNMLHHSLAEVEAENTLADNLAKKRGRDS